MGLASKLAAAQAASGPGGAALPPNSQQYQSQSQPGGTPGQQPYQSYNPNSYPPTNPSPQPPYGHQPYAQPPYGAQQQYPQAQQPPAQYPYQQSSQQPSYGQAPYQPSYQQYPPQSSYQQNSGYGYGQPPSQYPPQGQQQPQFPPPPNQSYPQQGQQYPPQGYGGQQFPQQQQQPPYGGGQGQPAGPQDIAAYKRALETAVQEKGLERFYPRGSPDLDRIAQQAAAKVDQVAQRWRLPKEVARDIARLGLYDIVLYIDDSGSMQFEEGGERIDDLKLILQRVAYAGTLFDPDGISVRFMNTVLPEPMCDNVRDERQIEDIMRSVKFSGLTPMGRELKKKVIDGIVLRDARQGHLKKPVLVIAITDGQPAGDEPNNNAVFDAVRYAAAEVERASGSRGGISFQFAQVGNDVKAREFLGRLDTDPSIGSLVDCTSNFEQEQQEMKNQNPPVDLTPDLWMVKLLLGSIDPSYDSKDEVRSYRPSGQQGPGQYGQTGPGQYGGAPPGGQYGQQPQYQGQGQGQQQYSRPPPPQPQGGYGGAGGPGGPGGYQSQGGYGQQQGGQQQGGYQGGAYGPPGGYGAPPPPPRY